MNTDISPKPQNTPASKPRQNRQARQQHILDATARCVRKAGFHGASMADIAREANMSVGVIYRYFANKEAIIEAIVANDLAEMTAKFAEFEQASDDQLVDIIVNSLEFAVSHKYTRENAGLALEVAAEAARNPNVEAIVQKSDAQERTLARGLLHRIAGPDADPERTLARGEILSMIFDGMLVRSVCNPDIDRENITKVLREVVKYVLTMK